MWLGISLYIALLNPSIALVLASAFVLLWLYQRPQTDLLILAAGYAAVAAGFLLQYFPLPIGVPPTRVLSNLLFLAGASTVAAGIIHRYERQVPIVAFAVLAGGGLLGFCWFMFVQPSLTWRILAVNFALGGVSLVAAAELRAVPNKTVLDRILLALALIAGLNFFVRTLAIIAVHGPYETYVGFRQSIYWTTVMLSHALLSIVMALCLIASSALRLIEDLQIEAQTDPLSGLLNRRGFEGRATKVLAQNEHRQLPAALVLCDLDHFKVVNDTYGHATGDQVIAAFAEHLRQTAPDSSVLGRIGGEEFAVLLPATGVMAARLFAEGMRVSLAGVAIDGLPDHLRISASFGVAVQDAGEPLSSVMSRADDALYQAKRSGRDRVRLSTHDASLAATDWMGRPTGT